MSETDTQTRKLVTGRTIVAFLAGLAVVYFVVNVAIDQRLGELQLKTKLLISEQEALLATVAETTARNGADEVTEQIIQDCAQPERIRFDELLSDLDEGLTQTELVELERLFGRCGNFFAERRAVMAARLQREIEVYEMFIEQLNNITESDNSREYQVKQWQQLAELESKQSQLFSDLVQAQDEIITKLLAGNAPSSETVRQTLQDASQIQETLIVTQAQASDIRSSLVSL